MIVKQKVIRKKNKKRLAARFLALGRFSFRAINERGNQEGGPHAQKSLGASLVFVA